MISCLVKQTAVYVTWGPDGRLHHTAGVYCSDVESWGAEATLPTLPTCSAEPDSRRTTITEDAPCNISIQYALKLY